jgi:redox-sensing transcriptional repressor
MICSADMEKESGISAAQFRKDLSYFGEFGKPGIGYYVSDLQRRIEKILKLDSEQSVVLVGAGNLGSALAAFPAWEQYRFNIVAVFDNNLSKIGRKLWDMDIFDIRDFTQLNQELDARSELLRFPL